MSRASLDKDPHEVAAMFDGVASGYDRANSFMTFGFDRRWRTTTARVLDARRGEKVLDLAAGTGVSTVEYARGGAWCLAADFSFGMLRAGLHRNVPMVAADALNLPFADESFDAVTISLALRNFVDTKAALTEIARVVKPGGKLLFLEHVRSDDAKVARWQDRIRPFYNLVGCNPNRSTLAAIEASPFTVDAVRHGEVPKAPKVERPMIVGSARR